MSSITPTHHRFKCSGASVWWVVCRRTGPVRLAWSIAAVPALTHHRFKWD